MYKGKKVAVILPCYNVQDQIVPAIEGLPEFVDFIIAVDDCSFDATVSSIKSVNDSRIVLLRNEINLGVGGATIAGFKKGLNLGADVFVKFDGDGQMNPDSIKDLLNPLLEGADYSKGNRFIHFDQLQKMPRTRLFGNFILTFLTKLASGYWKIFDPQNGFVAITRDALEKIPLDNLYERYFFENDMLVNLNVTSAKIVDVNMPAIYGNEKSSMKISNIIFSFPWLLINRFFSRVYKKYILYDFSIVGLFYFCGIFLLTFGGLFGAYHWIVSITTNVPATTGTVMISVLPIILGFQLFIQSIVLEVTASEGDSKAYSAKKDYD